MDTSHHYVTNEYYEYLDEEELVDEIDSCDEQSEYSLMSSADSGHLSTIAEETSLDLWTKGSTMSMPSLDDLDSICTVDSIVTDQDECCNESISGALDSSITETYGNDTQFQEVLKCPIYGSEYSQRESQRSRTTLSTASLSRTSSSLSSFAASPSSSAHERIPSISGLRNAQWDQVPSVQEQKTNSLVGVNIQFFVSTEYGSISPMEDLSEHDSTLTEEVCIEETSKANESKKKKKKKKKKDKKGKRDKIKDKKNQKDTQEKPKSKKTKNKKKEKSRVTKKDDVEKDLKQSKKKTKTLDSPTVARSRQRLREKIKSRIESIDKRLRTVSSIAVLGA